VYIVISPESCAAIIYRDSGKAEQAAAALRLTAQDLLSFGLIDDIVPEPAEGAHTDPAAAAENMREYVRRYLDEVRVPFEAWNLTPIDRPDWPGARRVATPADFYDALVALRRRISCQSIAWVETDFRTASVAARAADPALMRLPDAPTPVVPAEAPSDDITRTLEKIRGKER